MPVHDNSLSLLFVTIASNLFGYGHLNRCLSIAEHAKSEGATARFLLFGDERAQGRINAAGHSCYLRSISELEEGGEITFAGSADAVISDLVHATFFARTPPLELFKQFRSISAVSVAIDALGDQALVAQAPKVDVDLMVIPYATLDTSSRGGDYRLLSGPQYALLAPDYAALPPRTVRFHADQVLVSCGGSDPMGYTLVVLRGIEQISEKLQVRVVLGPLFSAGICAEIESWAANSRHEMVLVSAPEVLLDEMLWCDLAIAASGLTKYELAATGTPALLFSIDDLHDQINRPFAMIGTSVDLGVNITSELVSRQTEMLLGDFDSRKAMSVTGKQVVDGLGAKRLIAEIRRELSC
ncbi:MAG: hypothetical protein ABL960_12505 [Nitrospira sp.]